MRKIVLLVVALLAVVLVAAALQSRKDDREVDLQSHKLLSEQQLQILADTQAITLQRGQQEVKLVRQDDQWLVANSDNFPVLQPRLAALLLNLRGAEVQEEKTDNPDYHQRLGLSADSELPVLQVTLDAGDTTLGLLYGNAVGKGQLLRFADANQVLLINRPLTVSVNSHDWLDLQVSNVPLEQIAKARWEHADGETLVLDKAEQGDYNFRLAGEASAEGQERKLNSMVLALANLQAQNVSLRSKLALGQPGLSMQLDTWSGAQLAASLYQLDNQYWLTVDAVKQSDEQPLDVRIDPRWAYQLSVAQHDQLALRAADLQPAEVEVGE
ncbi:MULTISPECIES: DUF4340 domain-containing protein [Pseudomonas]|uniref:DUF4340 domain-containing protein n=1 Tax=Pseudomonas neustonica TaxID=2487346 RepID=A0ABX9XKD4_9PSED|nr:MULTISPECIES: DUF4340 domain-containing protein [Pseudomonas]MBA6418590.1 DUF4340 domain-containing protein [Pseudomonas sp. 5Ae-yellow]ROZ85037.1 DUF4340 domain-containing protein [Pseudomonas sp. SSM44]ROZ86676.1 DUF4340 domain-containing protein [Pseudomonas neustonica]|tara:strand:+ start:13592 stop:14572 length:981 start_codon:yes stop_codon:yes gene_type:complete